MQIVEVENDRINAVVPEEFTCGLSTAAIDKTVVRGQADGLELPQLFDASG